MELTLVRSNFYEGNINDESKMLFFNIYCNRTFFSSVCHGNVWVLLLIFF